MFGDIIKIAVLCIVIGGASIPVSFTVNNNPAIVWFGNALGSVISAVVVIYIGNRINDEKFRRRAKKIRIGNKVIQVFDQGQNSKGVVKTRNIINKRGLRLFSLLCPIFPGVLLSTAAVILLDLDMKIYKRWMFTGVVLVSGLYVYSYWWLVVK